MRRIEMFLILFVVTQLLGCANPLNQATSNRYSKICSDAELDGRLDDAEIACYRALANVDWGNLGDIERSQKMYNLARIKRQLNKFEEAEDLLQNSLRIEEKQVPISNERIGRRLAELAMAYGQHGLFQTGLPFVERLYAMSDIYQGAEKKVVSAIFYEYSRKLHGLAPAEITDKLAEKATAMGFTVNDVK